MRRRRLVLVVLGVVVAVSVLVAALLYTLAGLSFGASAIVGAWIAVMGAVLSPFLLVPLLVFAALLGYLLLGLWLLIAGPFWLLVPATREPIGKTVRAANAALRGLVPRTPL
jgi:hypothetical protein